MYLNRIIKNEAKASQHINIVSHYDDSTLIDKSGKLIKIIKLSGLDFVTQENQVLDRYKLRINNLLKSFSSDFAFYFWEIKRKVNPSVQGEFKNSYANDVNYQYQHYLKTTEMFHKELYLAVITKQPQGLINKGFSFIKQLFYKFDKQAKQDYLVKRHQELCDATHKILNVLSDYHCRLLSVYEKNDVTFSSPLSFISQLINGQPFAVPLASQDASSLLARKRLTFHGRSGTIELQAADGSKKYAAMLSIKGYSPFTHQKILDKLNFLRCEYVITQSYRFYDKQSAKKRLRDQQHEMRQTNDESFTQTEEIDQAFDEAASGDVGYGKHHFTLACYADSPTELNQKVGMLVASFSDEDIIIVREDVACEMAYWAQLPANFSYICRSADISTRNMAGLASMHNLPLGKAQGNHWGDAVTVFETITGSPFYFNFHYKDVGNFLVFGAMGSGKTVLIGFLILQSMRFGGKRIIFDKDRGLEILVRAMGGKYERLKSGQATGFNPCQLSDTTENRQFLFVLFKKMLSVNGEVLTESDNEIITHAIEGMYRLDSCFRQLCHLASFFGAKKAGSLRARFDQWHSEGKHAWLFDHATDSLSFERDVMGFDLGYILEDAECKTPALMYLTYRAEKALEGQRGMLFIDEGWLALVDEYFQQLINNWSRTPRKKDNIFGLATQVANDTTYSALNKSINESAFCKFFFPNPNADKKVYVNDLGLSESQYEYIKAMPDEDHYFLLVHGNGSNKQSVVARIQLEDDLLAVISARESTLALLDQLLLEVGDEPKHWLPLFHERRKKAA